LCSSGGFQGGSYNGNSDLGFILELVHETLPLVVGGVAINADPLGLIRLLLVKKKTGKERDVTLLTLRPGLTSSPLSKRGTLSLVSRQARHELLHLYATAINHTCRPLWRQPLTHP